MMRLDQGHPATRHVRHLWKVTSRATDIFGQIGNVFSRTTTPPERAHVLLLETVGQLYKELGAWRKHLAVLAFKGGMSQRAVADAVQVSRRTIQVWIEETDREMARMQTPQDQSCMPDGYDDVEAA